MTELFFILNDDRTLKPVNASTWGKWFETHQLARTVRQENIEDYWVSTVFLGLNHDWTGRAKPLVFETMILNRKTKEWSQTRCSTWAEAEAQHLEAVEWARGDHEST